ncbi:MULTISPECIES: DUF5512 family protein [Bacillus]|uniref:DUF5512 family protein n=1 Tax=Bacillus TaxID=1386 RepID=UPI00122EB27B|nr:MULTISPECIES: DUF5512 family protein [Bacillus]MDA1876396.1 DUF5512 family protein [Bacillus cereus group sp. BY112LC]QEQ20333.1 hypothetical protein F0362_27475 [Bacillus sp. BS98]
MLKNIKYILMLLIGSTLLLSGCGDTSTTTKEEPTQKETTKKETIKKETDNDVKHPLPYEKGVTYQVDAGAFSIEVMTDDEWKVWGYGNEPNEGNYQFYKIEQTEYSRGEYFVIKVSLKQSFGDSRSPFSTKESDYFYLHGTEKGFAIIKLGTSEENNMKWNDFKKAYNGDTNKKRFLENYPNSGHKWIDHYNKVQK